MGDLSVPFEENDQPDWDVGPFIQGEDPLYSDPLYSGGVAIVSLVMSNESTFIPALGFRFTHADGSGFMPPIIFACDDPKELLALSGLVGKSVRAAIKATETLLGDNHD